MASIEKRPNGSWRARWREYPSGPQKTKHFDRKVDAERFLTEVRHQILSGSYIDPASSRITVADYYATWFARMCPTWRVSTAAAVSNSIEKHALPTFGGRPLSSLKRADVEAFCASLPLAASTVATIHQHLGQLFACAVDDGLIVRNPASKARLPKREATRAQPISLDVIERLGAEMPDWFAIVVPLGDPA